MSRAMLALVGVLAALAASSGSARAADLPATTYEPSAPDCGPCGCLTVKWVYHREVETTYGAGFDPRNYDTTEPHFYLGPIRRYPRYFVNGVPVPPPWGSCWH
jgi:hypothetical protein